MLELKFHVMFTMICSVLTGVVGIYVLSRNIKSAIHWSCFGFCFSAALWQGFYALAAVVNHDQLVTEIWYRIGFSAVAFIGIYAADYSIRLVGYRKLLLWSKFNIFYSSVSAVFILTTDQILAGMHSYPWGFYPKAGPWHLFWVVYYLLVVNASVLVLVVKLLDKNTGYTLRNQIKYVLAAYCIMALGCQDFLPNYGPAFWPFQFYPMGFLSTTIFSLLLAYTIVKLRLMDISIVLQKGVVYSLLIALITFIYLAAIVIFERIFQNVVGYQNTAGSIVITLMIALVFNPLKSRIQTFVEKTIFKGTAAEITAQNERLRQEISQSERYKTLAALTSGIIDEIKAPLTALKGYGHFLPEKMNDPEFLKKYTQLQQSELSRINEMLQHLTQYSNPEPLAAQDTMITKLLNETLGMLKSVFIQGRIDVTRDFKANMERQMRIDPSQFRQALSNIIMNAIEAMPQGGSLFVGTEETDEHFHIFVRDTGSGISKEDLFKVFDPFFSRKDKHPGLGLSIAQGIIENHGGKVHIRSEAGKWTEVVVELPLVEKEKPVSASRSK